MAKDYLTVQASSVPSERAFSFGTDLGTHALSRVEIIENPDGLGRDLLPYSAHG